jgi:hypothetical protein
MMPTIAGTPCSVAAPVDTSVTSTTVGASLSPDSASNEPVSLLGSGTTRSTENTAAASVGEVTAPSSTASSHGSPRTKWEPTATTATETATPMVASETPRRTEDRISRQLVVRPPSARMIASAAKPSEWATSGFSNSTPMPASPRATPIRR